MLFPLGDSTLELTEENTRLIIVKQGEGSFDRIVHELVAEGLIMIYLDSPIPDQTRTQILERFVPEISETVDDQGLEGYITKRATTILANLPGYLGTDRQFE